jgi:hypothetical protein
MATRDRRRSAMSQSNIVHEPEVHALSLAAGDELAKLGGPRVVRVDLS